MVKAPVGGAKHHSLLLPSCSAIALVATCVMVLALIPAAFLPRKRSEHADQAAPVVVH